MKVVENKMGVSKNIERRDKCMECFGQNGINYDSCKYMKSQRAVIEMPECGFIEGIRADLQRIAGIEGSEHLEPRFHDEFYASRNICSEEAKKLLELDRRFRQEACKADE